MRPILGNVRPRPEPTSPTDVLVAFFAIAIGWLAAAAVAGAVAAVGGAPGARWLALHLAFVGGLSQLVLGAAQFFAGAFLATGPPPRRAIRSELVLWNAGAALIAFGVSLDATWLTAAGGGLIIATLGVFVASLHGMRRRSLQRAPWATRWYTTAALFLVVGAGLGPVMAAGTTWPYGTLLGAHLACNIGGWFGTAIVGTLHTFYPSLTGTRLRWPRLQPLTFAAWTCGIVLLATGLAFDQVGAAGAGWLLLLGAGAGLGANLVASARTAGRRTSAPILIAAGQVMLAAALGIALVVTITAGSAAPLLGENRVALGALIVVGWIGLTVAGSMLHLLSVMARVRGGLHPDRSRPLDPLALAAGAAVAWGLLEHTVGALLDSPLVTGSGRTLMVAGGALLAGRILALANRAVRAAPIRL